MPVWGVCKSLRHLFYTSLYLPRLAFKKNLEPSHGVLQLLKKNVYSVLLLHLLKPLFSVFRELQALSICFVSLNDLYIGDPLEADKRQEISYSSKTLLMNTLNNCRVNPSPAVCIRSFNHIPQSKSMHIMPRGHIETDPSTSGYFVTFSLE